MGPFLVILYKLIFLQGMTLYSIALLSPAQNLEELFIEEIENKQYPGGGDLFHIMEVKDKETGIQLLHNHDVLCLLIFNDREDQAEIEIWGDFSNPYYLLCSQLIQNNIKDFILTQSNLSLPINIKEKALEKSGRKSEFEHYIPGLIVFSLLPLIYLFSLILIRTLESRTFQSSLKSESSGRAFMGTYTFTFICLGFIAALLTISTAYILGFHSAISVWHDISRSLMISILLSLTTSGISFIITAFTTKDSKVLILATFPFMPLVFFSGSVYPFPRIPLFSLFGRTIGLFDLLPSTHGVNALGKILTFASPLRSLIYEMTVLTILSTIIYILGIRVFIKKRWQLKDV